MKQPLPPLTAEQVLLALQQLSDEQIRRLSSVGVNFPLLTQTGLVDVDELRSKARWGYYCENCGRIALLFPGDRWMNRQGQPNMRSYQHRRDAAGRPEVVMMPPVDVPLSGITVISAFSTNPVDRSAPVCEGTPTHTCGQALPIDAGRLVLNNIVEIDTWKRIRDTNWRICVERMWDEGLVANNWTNPDGSVATFRDPGRTQFQGPQGVKRQALEQVLHQTGFVRQLADVLASSQGG